MKEMTKKPEHKFISFAKQLFKPTQKSRSEEPSVQTTDEFRYFTLVPIPITDKKDIQTFCDEVAAWVGQSLENKPNVSFLEFYLTRTAMSRLSREVGIDTNYKSIIEYVNGRLPSATKNEEQDSSRVAFNRLGLFITPALQRIFDNAFIVREIVPPQVYTPPDENEIPVTADQFLIGSLKVEDARKHELGETPIRAILSSEGEQSRILPLHTHADFDILLKAFPDEEFCAYPLGVHINCRLEIDGTRRWVRQVDLDLHDTKLLASKSQSNESAKLFYYVLEGGNTQRNITEVPETYSVELKSESALRSVGKSGDLEDSYEIVRGSGLRVPVAGKVGIQVVLKITDRSGKLHTDTYRFLFRFFRHALRFSTKKNSLAASGQFVCSTGDTVVMLPPMLRNGKTEVQTPAFIISPEDNNQETFDIRLHPDSALNLYVDGNRVNGGPMRVNVTGRVEIRGEIGDEADSNYERFNFVLLPLTALNDQRKKVAEERKDRNFAGFIEVASDRTISLARNEVVLGRNQLLGRSVNVGLNALTLTQRYVTWVMTAKKDEKVYYYSTAQGSVAQPVRGLNSPVLLNMVGTYYVYVGDFEFTIFLESTPRTEILFDSGN